MLTGDSINYYSNNVERSASYKVAVIKLKEWYNGGDEKSKILSKWQMSLTREMMEEPSESKVAVFGMFDANFISLQNQLNT